MSGAQDAHFSMKQMKISSFPSFARLVCNDRAILKTSKYFSRWRNTQQWEEASQGLEMVRRGTDVLSFLPSWTATGIATFSRESKNGHLNYFFEFVSPGESTQQ